MRRLSGSWQASSAAIQSSRPHFPSMKRACSFSPSATGCSKRRSNRWRWLTGVSEQGQPITAPFDATATVCFETPSPVVSEANAITVDIKQQTTERIVVRRSRPKPAGPTGDLNDPPF